MIPGGETQVLSMSLYFLCVTMGDFQDESKLLLLCCRKIHSGIIGRLDCDGWTLEVGKPARKCL